MSIPSKEYWAQRALKRETESMQACAELTDKLFREYEAAARVIRRDIADFYARYGEKHGLSYEESIRTLSREEMREWKATLSEYVAKIATETDPEVKKKLTAQLDALSMNSRITRLEALEGQIDLILNDLYDKGVSQMKEEFGDMFTESYYKKCYDIQSRRGFFNEIAKISPEEVEHVLSYPWSGAMFSDRLWQNKQTLIYSVREILTQGVIQGKSIDAMTQALAGKMGQSYKAAERLIRTETNYIHNESSRAAYNAAGIEKYEFMASLNERTCEMCGELDGKVFLVKDAVAGTNYPPIHPNCRCTTVEYDAEDTADNIASSEPMAPQLHYDEWKQKQIEVWELREQQKREAEPIYKKMQEKGLMRLPELDKFAEMRYNTSPAYQKLFARYQNLTGERSWSAVEFNPETLASHFHDHGKDFDAASEQEYEDMALAFINGSAAKESFMDLEGTRRFFSEESGIFASVYPDGTIRTFFKPKKGKKYWDGQVKKYGSEEQN